MKRMIAGVTGLGAICAAGDFLDAIMPAMYSGKRSPEAPIAVNTGLDRISPVFEIASELLAEGYASRTSLLALAAVKEAMKQACLDRSVIKGKRVGVVLGTTVGCTLNNEPFYRAYREKKHPDIKPIKSYLANNPALFIADIYGCSGPAVTIANACSSGTDAVGLAKRWIERDICDIVIAGGADELCRTTYIGFTSLLITSMEPCRPFDRNRKGLNLGEGAGIVIVESRYSAEGRGAKLLAYVTGYGSSGDAHHPTAPHPDGLGLRRAIGIALKDAETAPQQISFVNAHGTSTQDNDRVEGKVISDLFPKTTPVVSTKAYTGHTLGAAGGIEAVFTIRALHDGQLPKTAGFEEPDQECGIVPTTTNTPVTGKTAISNSLAFGGNNSVLVLSREPS